MIWHRALPRVVRHQRPGFRPRLNSDRAVGCAASTPTLTVDRARTGACRARPASGLAGEDWAPWRTICSFDPGKEHGSRPSFLPPRSTGVLARPGEPVPRNGLGLDLAEARRFRCCFSVNGIGLGPAPPPQCRVYCRRSPPGCSTVASAQESARLGPTLGGRAPLMAPDGDRKSGSMSPNTTAPQHDTPRTGPWASPTLPSAPRALGTATKTKLPPATAQPLAVGLRNSVRPFPPDCGQRQWGPAEKYAPTSVPVRRRSAQERGECPAIDVPGPSTHPSPRPARRCGNHPEQPGPGSAGRDGRKFSASFAVRPGLRA